MKRRNKDWSVEKLSRERSRITFPEYQREKRLWTKEKKGLLIDSILRDIDIPKLYFYLLKDGNIEVMDGQQRLWSVWDFLDGEFEYKGDDKKRKISFRTLSASEKKKLLHYEFQVTLLEDVDEDYLRLLFIRLQLGLLLNTGEKLHAASGKMKQLVFRKLANHQFIRNIGIPERRFAKETLCAQICINSFRRAKLNEFAGTRYEILEVFFGEYADPRGKDLELFNARSKEISATMDQLGKCFGGNAKNLRNRSYILSIYLFLEEFISKEGKLSTKEQKSFSNFVSQLWKRLKEESKLGIDRTNRELYSFQTFLNSAPGEAYQIRHRHDKLSEYYEHFKNKGKIKGDK